MEYGLVVLWLATYLVLGALALPLSATIFRQFRGAGSAFAIPVALVTIAVVGYLVGHLAFGVPALIAGVAVLGGSSLRFGDPDRTEWRSYAEVAVVFTLAFSLMISIRAASPAIAPLPIAAGEKFLDYGLLRTILRSAALPPEDMWFAGESVQYYYGGQLLTALLTILTGTAPRFAYNLALSGFYAALVTAAYGLTGAIAADHGAPRRLAAVIGAFFVGLAGNLYTAVQVAAWLLPSSVVTAFGVAPDSELLAWTPSSFFYWDSSRIIDGTINEFPLFAWLNGDLHAHMLTTPFTLLIAALCYSYWQTPETDTGRRRALLLLTAPVAGFLAIANTWDFPVAGGLVFLTVAFAPADPATLLPTRLATRFSTRSGVREELRRDGLSLLGAVFVLVVGGLSVAPFWLSSASTRGIGFLPPRSDLGPLLIVHGGFLLLFVPYLTGRIVDEFEDRSSSWAVATAAAVAVGAIAAWTAGFAALALFGPILLAAWLCLRNRTDLGFETVLLLGGLGLALVVEFVYVVEPQQRGTGLERLNTVFKVYSQLWVLWSPAAGVIAARLAADRLPGSASAVRSIDATRWRSIGTVVVAIAVVFTGLYAGLAIPAQVGDDPIGSDGATLDGEAYLDARYAGETAAIAWIDDRDGQPTIVTAAPGGYQWVPEDGEGASAPASLTGVPTVLGWFHEAQYRGSEPYEDRLADVRTIYEGNVERQSALLDRYDVEYVYVGPAERASYELSVEDHPRLTPAFEDGDVIVYAYEAT
jgi:YYY domain-containing protein